MKQLRALYYPFSRCVNPSSLKQMLLVFDELSFVDPVSDDRWRAKLMKDLVPLDRQFGNYKQIDTSLASLIDSGCIAQVDPSKFANIGSTLATATALSDLQDPKWLAVASNPQKFQMPTISMHGTASWQVFRPKLPEEFIGALVENRTLRQHILHDGGIDTAWSLSYAAGSAIGIGVHLEIAERKGVAPVTDSRLHHRLFS